MRRSKKNAVGEVHDASVDEMSFTQEELLDEVSWAEDTMNVDDAISSVPSSAVEIGKAAAAPFRTMYVYLFLEMYYFMFSTNFRHYIHFYSIILQSGFD